MDKKEIINFQEKKNRKLEEEWNMDLFKNSTQITKEKEIRVESHICHIASKNGILDFYKSAFPINKVAYGITNLSPNATADNKYIKGYIDIMNFFGLKEDLDNIFYNCDLIRAKQAPQELLEKVKKDGLFTYRGKFVDKEKKELYCRWFQIKPADKEETVFITILNMKGKETDTGMVIPIEAPKSISVNCSYFDLKAAITFIIHQYDYYSIYSYQGKEVEFFINNVK